MSVRIQPVKKEGKELRGVFDVDIRVLWPGDRTSSRERVRIRVSTKSEARTWGEVREREIYRMGKEEWQRDQRRAQTTKATRTPTWSEFWPRYLSEHCHASGNAESTIDLKTTMFNAYLKPHIGDVRLDELEPAHIDKFKAAHTHLGARIVNNALGLLANMRERAQKWKLIGVIPFDIEKRKVPKSEASFYSFAEWRRLIESATALGPMFVVVVLLGGRAGMRRGEIIALRWEHVDFERNVIRVAETVYKDKAKAPKSGKGRTVPMTREVRDALLPLRGGRADRVVRRTDGATVTPGTIRMWLAQVEEGAGFESKGLCHKLRHTMLSHLAMLGSELRTIQELAGHHALAMTERYLHLQPSAKDNAMALLDVPPPARLLGGSIAAKDNVETTAEK